MLQEKTKKSFEPFKTLEHLIVRFKIKPSWNLKYQAKFKKAFHFSFCFSKKIPRFKLWIKNNLMTRKQSPYNEKNKNKTFQAKCPCKSLPHSFQS